MSFFGLKAVDIPLDNAFKPDLALMEKAINKRTVLLVGSAPQYPQESLTQYHK
ncbi:MAG: hypothetical protein IPJ22_00580 [Bacteroidetes bacterium]|nr:hypothetical protein [Bacteroidota bacterium]